MNNSSFFGFDDVVTRLSDEQCKKIIAMFSRKLASSNVVTTHEFKAGTHYILNTTSRKYKSSVWIIDSRHLQ